MDFYLDDDNVILIGETAFDHVKVAVVDEDDYFFVTKEGRNRLSFVQQKELQKMIQKGYTAGTIQ